MEVKMEDKKKKTAGYVFLGIFAVMLILVIVGMCIGGITDTGENGTGNINAKLFSDELKIMTEICQTSPTLAIVGYIVAIVGICALVAYTALKLFLNKSIRLLGILGAVTTLAGGILIMVGGIMMAYMLNTMGGISDKNLEMFDPNVGIFLGGLSGVVAAIAGFVAASKKFN